MELDRFDRFARRNHGLVSRTAAEVTATGWRELLDDKQVDGLHRDVARLFGTATTAEQRIAAAVLAAGAGAMASHRSAARLWGGERPPDDPVDVLLPQRQRRSRIDAVVHRPRDLAQLEPVRRAGIPCTDPLRTLLDLGAVDPEGVYPLLRHLVMSRVVSAAAVRAALVRHGRRGRSGVGALRRALELWSIDERPVDSDLESLMSEILSAYGLPSAQFHAHVGGFEVDFLIVGTTVIIECDGWSTHGLDRAQFEFDRLRDARLLAAGYLTIRVTWRQMTRQPAAVAARIELALRHWCPSVLGATRAA